MKQQQQIARPSPVSWLAAEGEDRAAAELAKIPQDASREGTIRALQELVAKLLELKQYDSFDPKQLHTVTFKVNYREVEKIEFGASVSTMQVLPGDRIVVGSFGKPVCMFSRDKEGTWEKKDIIPQSDEINCLRVLPNNSIIYGSGRSMFINVTQANGAQHTEKLQAERASLNCLKALPDGRILSGGSDGSLSIWRKDAEEKWEREKLPSWSLPIHSVDVLADGRLVTGEMKWAGHKGVVRILSKDAQGEWSGVELLGHTHTPLCLQALSDGRIVSGSLDHTIRIWKESQDGTWTSEVLPGHAASVHCLQVLPDGRVVSGIGNSIHIHTKRPDGVWTCEMLQGHDREIESLQVLPDGRIVSGSVDGTIRIWDGDEIAGA